MQNGLLYSAHSFINDHITFCNCYYFLSLSKKHVKIEKQKQCRHSNIEIGINEFKKFILKILRVILSAT